MQPGQHCPVAPGSDGELCAGTRPPAGVEPGSRASAGLALALALAGCAGDPEPAVYPSSGEASHGEPAPAEVVADCERLARDGSQTEAVARNVGRSAVVGGVTGAVWGSFSGAAGRGFGIGSLAGAAAGLVGSALSPPASPPDRDDRVMRCLEARGYRVAGWR